MGNLKKKESVNVSVRQKRNAKRRSAKKRNAKKQNADVKPKKKMRDKNQIRKMRTNTKRKIRRKKWKRENKPDWNVDVESKKQKKSEKLMKHRKNKRNHRPKLYNNRIRIKMICPKLNAKHWNERRVNGKDCCVDRE